MPETTPLSYGNFVKVTIDVDGTEVVIGGLDSFNIDEDTRNILDVPRVFQDDRSIQIVGEKNARGFQFTGFYLTEQDDQGWQELQNKYDAAETIEGEIGPGKIKFFTDDGTSNGGTQFQTPSSGSYVKITSMGPTSAAREGWITYGAAGIIFGDFEQQTGS